MTKRSTKLRAMTALLLAGWCLLFFRCETTEKSMVRAVYLAQTENGVTAALWVQAPQAAADASEASAALKMTRAEGETLEKALYSAQKLLPETADYRLYDFSFFRKIRRMSCFRHTKHLFWNADAGGQRRGLSAWTWTKKLSPGLKAMTRAFPTNFSGN